LHGLGKPAHYAEADWWVVVQSLTDIRHLAVYRLHVMICFHVMLFFTRDVTDSKSESDGIRHFSRNL